MIQKQRFKREVIHWAKEVGVKPKEVHMRKMPRKWGSCSSKGRLTFSYALLYKPYPFRAKAIVHELLHLRYPTHTKMFNSLLSAHLNKKGIKPNNIKL